MHLALSLIAFLLWQAPAHAETSGFYNAGTFHSFEMDPDLVAVHGRLDAPRSSLNRRLSLADQAALAQLGLTLIPASDRVQDAAKDPVVGIPIHFAGRHQAFAVLPSDIVVQTTTSRVLRTLRLMTGFRKVERVTFHKHLYHALFTTPQAALKGANTLYSVPGVTFAHPNFVMPKTFRSAPDATHEPLFAEQWHLENRGQLGGTPGADLHIRGAWKVTQGDPRVVIAVLDGGIDLGHPDLAQAWGRNLGEIPNNGIDDDHNGFIDDVIGWNFASGSPDLSMGVAPEHGVATAGIAAARANGQGIAGVCPGCTLLPIVIAWTPLDDAAALHYARARGAAIISNSWGYSLGAPTTDVVRDAIKDVANSGALIVFAMNNVHRNDCEAKSPDISAAPGAIAVSASNDQDQKVAASGYGSCLRLLAPTWDEDRPGIATTYLRASNSRRDKNDFDDPAYTKRFRGTSAATPMVAGIFGLMLSARPSLSAAEVLNLALKTADRIEPERAHYDQNGFSMTHGYGRINAERAVQAALGKL